VVEHATYHENIRKNLNPFVLYGGTRITDADPWLSLFFDGKEIPDPATGNKGTNFAHYKGIDDLLHAGRVERDVKKRAAIYAEAQKRMERDLVCLDRKSTRLNSSHQIISYAVFCLKKKNNKNRKEHSTAHIHK